MADARRRVVISGRVQGVFFRDSVRREATERGLTGWVTNRDDGRVEAVFEGEADAVGELVAYCRSGPEQAAVEDVEVTDEEPAGEQRFEVR